MPALIQPSFAAGEVSADLYGRVDLDLYRIGLQTCKNFIVRQYGGVANRPGLKYLAPCRYPLKKARLIPFQFNEVQAYELEFGDQYMRVVMNDGHVLEASVNISAITKANPGVFTTSVAHGLTTGDDVFVRSVSGMTEVNNRFFRVTVLSGTTFSIQDFYGTNVDTTGYTTYTSGGTIARVYTVATPYLEADLFNLNYAQNKDVMTICEDSYYPRDITRTGHASWTVTQFDNQQGPFKDINVTATGVYTSAATGSGITLTATASLFDAGMVGSLFYIEQKPDDTTKRWEVSKVVALNDVRRAGFNYYKATAGGTTGTYKPDWVEGSSNDGDPGVNWSYLHSGFGIVKITGFTSATVVTVDVVKRLPDNVVGIANATTNWSMAAWSASEGYPQSLTYAKQRMIFGGSTNQPNTLWMSGVALRTFFGRSNPLLDDEGITLSLDTVEVNAIRHLLPLSDLIALTSASAQLINGKDETFASTSPPFAKVQTNTGTSKVRPLIIGTSGIYVEDTGTVVRSLQYDFASNTFGGIDLSARSPHLFENRSIVDWAFQRQPFSVAWTIMDDGALIGLTFMEEQKVYAWHRHETDGTFESVSTLREGRENAVYFIINRTINGKTARYIEKMASRNFTLIEDAYFLDSGLQYDGRNTGATTMTITGGTTWGTPEILTITSSTAKFAATDINNQIVFYDGIKALRLVINGFTSSTVVSAVPLQTVPVAFRSVARTDWRFARKTFSGLNHLEGKTLTALSEGNVIRDLVVSGGKVTLTDPSAVLSIGLSYVADIETLEVSGPNGEVRTEITNIPEVNFILQKSRGGLYGTNGFDHMTSFVERSIDQGYDVPIPATNKVQVVNTNNTWSNRGRVTARQADPLPLTINAIRPQVKLGRS